LKKAKPFDVDYEYEYVYGGKKKRKTKRARYMKIGEDTFADPGTEEGEWRNVIEGKGEGKVSDKKLNAKEMKALNKALGVEPSDSEVKKKGEKKIKETEVTDVESDGGTTVDMGDGAMLF
jgi:hypothetical protein